MNYNCVAIVDHSTKNSYQDHSVIAGHVYYYKVILFNYAGESEASDVVGPLTASAGSEILPEEWAFEDVGANRYRGRKVTSIPKAVLCRIGSGT